MYDIEKKVKASFIEIYFNNENYFRKNAYEFNRSNKKVLIMNN